MKRETSIFLFAIIVAAIFLSFLLGGNPKAQTSDPSKSKPPATTKLPTIPPAAKALPAVAAASVLSSISQSLTFSWDQPVAKPEDRANIWGWTIYMSATSGGTYEQKVDVEDLSGSNPVISKQSFTISGAAATSVRRYFTIEAIGKDGNRSARSQEVYWDFSIPNWILSPVNVIIKVEVQQQ